MIHSNRIRESEGMEGMKDEMSCDQENYRMISNFTYMQMTNQVNAKKTYKGSERTKLRNCHTTPQMT